MLNSLSVTVDVEDWYHVPAVSGSTFSKYSDTNEFFSKWKGRYDYITHSTHRVLDLLEEFGIRATFFIVAEVVLRYKGLVEAIQRKGHEIACHGYDHRCYIDPKTRRPTATREMFKERVGLAKRVLEGATRKTVVGFRVPATYVSGWMLDIIEEEGFEYDSSVSVNSLYNKTDSKLKGVRRTPYFPQRGGLEPGLPRALLEIPWPYYQIGPILLPCAGGPMLRFLGSRFILRGLKQSLQAGHAFLYFHPLDVVREKFPSGFSIRRPFYWAIKGRVVEDRIRWILSKLDSNIMTMSEVSKKYKRMLRSDM